jgi:ankyrin repeat protein
MRVKACCGFRRDRNPMAKRSRFFHLRSAVSVAGLVLACLFAAKSAWAVEAATCRELERRFDLIKADLVSIQRNSALFSAADAGCEEFARRLLAAGASLAARDRLGAMPLAHAARAGQRALVELFLAKGAQFDGRDISGSTALYLAAESERPAAVASLLAKGADPNIPGRSGATPLAAAAFKGNDRIVEQLLSHGADPNVVDATGKAAMSYAAARGFAEIVRQLLAAGVDAKVRYGNDLTALMWAAGHEDGVGASAAQRTLDLLLGHGAPVDAVDDRGRTALMMAAELGHAEVVEMLIGRGADQGVRDKSGKSALDLAGNENVRRMLAEHRSGSSIP